MSDIYKKYPVINDNIIVKNFPDGLSFQIKNAKKTIRISNDYWQIYKKFVGNKNLSSIYEELSEDWEIDKDELRRFISEALDRKFIELNDFPTYREISLIGDGETYYPSAVSVEITNKCNIKCIYCYGSYESKNKNILEFERLKEMFSFFQSCGTLALEITGGEPLLHPNFNEICEFGLKCFPRITILSNGSLFNEAHFDLIKKNINRISLQISIDGISEETNAIVRGVGNTWERTLNTIKRLLKMEAKLRIVYMLTKSNAHELKEACGLMRNLGVKNCFTISPAMNIGRGHNSECSIISNMILTEEYIEILEEIQENNSDIIYHYPWEKESEDYIKREYKNCGAGWKIIAISADGNVKACHLLDHNGIIGNIYKESLKSIFKSDKAVNFFQKFQKEVIDEGCDKCLYKVTCARCIFKVFEANKELIAHGKDICPVAKRNKMDLYFNLKKPVE